MRSRQRNQSKQAVIFYDTFDWRLFNKCMVLCRTGDELVVRQLAYRRRRLNA